MPLKLAVLLICFAAVAAESPYRYYTWNVTYGTIYPLGVPQQGILINGQFPGPVIDSVTNDNVFINVYNSLNEPFLIHWNGVQNRRNSFVDGVFGTTCPIPPGQNFTYMLQMKDQIGSFFYFPSLAFHKAAGGFGGIKILSRPLIPVPFPPPADDYTVLIGDWYKTNHTVLRAILNRGKKLPFPHGILINGRGPNGTSFTVEQGKTYRLRICNVGLQNSLNIRIQDHKMKVVEVEGTHTMQISYSSLDIHLGQCMSVLVTADQQPKSYYIVVSSRFTTNILTSTAFLRYANSNSPPSGPLPGGPTTQVDWSLNQARSIRTNLTASGPRPNPQGSYHYGMINTSRTIRLASSAGQVNNKQRYAINSVSFVVPDTPLKLADYFKIDGVFHVGSIPDAPNGRGIYLDTSVLGTDYRTFIEIVFENYENIVQSYHLSGYSFWVVGMDGGQWTSASRNQYNLRDAVARCTVQVYPKSWTAIYVALDNVGMWNLRSEFWARQYLGQQLYVRVYTASTSLRDEYPIPKNALLCGWAKGRHTRPF
ncbi:Multicopper oxidase [Handroanthus impetiginosus]|uniref:Multicopper oxidase n=1 Tax=Handroanthus impetiginosus TaxID=429701 RepID=A0A2G9G579_9LAMI|nr:Multicopper oxidase [Handroanthus impetiginosus]